MTMAFIIKPERNQAGVIVHKKAHVFIRTDAQN